VKLSRAGKGEVILFRNKSHIEVHAINIFKILCHVHMDVYLEQKQSGIDDNNTSIIVFQGRSNNK
jgi:hypothetical protein